MKKAKRLLCALLVAGMILVGLVGQARADQTQLFPDIPDGADYADAVLALASMGIIVGDQNGNFNPNSTITRAEAATIICRMLGVENEARQLKTCTFADTRSHWSVGYVAKASELGIISGYNSSTFGPDDPVTYIQMVKLLVCALEMDKAAQDAGGWPNGYRQVAENLGLLVGISETGNGQINRANVVKMIYNSIF